MFSVQKFDMHMETGWFSTRPMTQLLFLDFWHFLRAEMEQIRGVQMFHQQLLKKSVIYLYSDFLGGLMRLCFRSFSFHTNTISAEARAAGKRVAALERLHHVSWGQQHPKAVLTHFLHKHTIRERQQVCGSSSIFLLSHTHLLNMVQDIYLFISTLIYSGNSKAALYTCVSWIYRMKSCCLSEDILSTSSDSRFTLIQALTRFTCTHSGTPLPGVILFFPLHVSFKFIWRQCEASAVWVSQLKWVSSEVKVDSIRNSI